MNRSPQPRSQRGFTRMELMFVVVGVLLLACLAMLFVVNQRTTQETRKRISCVSNLKHVGLGFRVFANDNDDRFPFHVTNSLGFTNITWAWEHFQAMSNEMGSANILVCRADRERLNNRMSDFGMGPHLTSTSLAGHGNAAISYFVSLDAHETLPNVMLVGDRNLVTNSGNLQGKVFASSPASLSAWDERQHGRRGNATLADGSVQQMTNPMLEKQVAISSAGGPGTNRLLLPLLP
jgi:prepilin-type processing-associated H-X9-DG protein